MRRLYFGTSAGTGRRDLVATPDAADSRMEALVNVLETGGIATRHTQRIRDAVWSKIAANLTSNPLSVMTGSTLAQLYSHPSLQKVVCQLFEETRLTRYFEDSALRQSHAHGGKENS